MGQRRALLDLPATHRGPQAARAMVRTLLSAWGRDGVVDDAEIVVSELVTNAVKHSPGTHTVELELVERSDGVRLYLADGSSIRPIVAELSDDAETGRGMRIVAAIADNWGADDHHGGKRVWVDLREQN